MDIEQRWELEWITKTSQCASSRDSDGDVHAEDGSSAGAKGEEEEVGLVVPCLSISIQVQFSDRLRGFPRIDPLFDRLTR